jgi:hypothetical protein
MRNTSPQVRVFFLTALRRQISHHRHRYRSPIRRVLVVFRDQVYKHLEAIPPGDYDAIANKLIQAGSTLEFLKYADALFDILFVGGLLQPGGLYLDAEGPTSPFSLFQIEVSAEPDEIKKFVEVLNKLIRR